LVDDLPSRVKDKRLKREQIAARALDDMTRWRDEAIAEERLSRAI
jgi:folate-dependent tRNA-U54 methylase TrmFO/GidA